MKTSRQIKIDEHVGKKIDALRSEEHNSYSKVIQQLLDNQETYAQGTYSQTYIVGLNDIVSDKLRNNGNEINVVYNKKTYKALCTFRNKYKADDNQSYNACTFKVVFPFPPTILSNVLFKIELEEALFKL